MSNAWSLDDEMNPYASDPYAALAQNTARGGGRQQRAAPYYGGSAPAASNPYGGHAGAAAASSYRSAPTDDPYQALAAQSAGGASRSTTTAAAAATQAKIAAIKARVAEVRAQKAELERRMDNPYYSGSVSSTTATTGSNPYSGHAGTGSVRESLISGPKGDNKRKADDQRRQADQRKQAEEQRRKVAAEAELRRRREDEERRRRTQEEERRRRDQELQQATERRAAQAAALARQREQTEVQRRRQEAEEERRQALARAAARQSEERWREEERRREEQHRIREAERRRYELAEQERRRLAEHHRQRQMADQQVAPPAPKPKPICKFYQEGTQCRFGAECHFTHPGKAVSRQQQDQGQMPRRRNVVEAFVNNAPPAQRAFLVQNKAKGAQAPKLQPRAQNQTKPKPPPPTPKLQPRGQNAPGKPAPVMKEPAKHVQLNPAKASNSKTIKLTKAKAKNKNKKQQQQQAAAEAEPKEPPTKAPRVETPEEIKKREEANKAKAEELKKKREAALEAAKLKREELQKLKEAAEKEAQLKKEEAEKEAQRKKEEREKLQAELRVKLEKEKEEKAAAQKALFIKYDSTGAGKLLAVDVVALAQVEHEVPLTEEEAAEIVGTLDPSKAGGVVEAKLQALQNKLKVKADILRKKAKEAKEAQLRQEAEAKRAEVLAVIKTMIADGTTKCEEVGPKVTEIEEVGKLLKSNTTHPGLKAEKVNEATELSEAVQPMVTAAREALREAMDQCKADECEVFQESKGEITKLLTRVSVMQSKIGIVSKLAASVKEELAEREAKIKSTKKTKAIKTALTLLSAEKGTFLELLKFNESHMERALAAGVTKEELAKGLADQTSAKVRYLGFVIKEAMAKEEKSFEQLYPAAAGGMDKESFAKLGEGKELPEGYLDAVFDKLQVDGKVTDFTPLSQQKYKVLKECPMHDGVDVLASKKVKVLAVGDVLVTNQAPVIDPKLGVPRVNVVAGNKEGWATVKGNQGTVFLQPVD
eukprot:CAMPEP_0204393728 /NCGR_PEP_ID=MMETSP0469-20131031/62472_1 /ASSEMBLY_ACC=CAM_ASM_000384 /TAXON_ID=2969 /ORGANISM="Oxyrrhis marina" /LENGTH=991 /DNA_ID=CAMNT_0051387815 /DNA_START=22 /DNA_END=2997 /DNA_ORIENTATION=-